MTYLNISGNYLPEKIFRIAEKPSSLPELAAENCGILR